MYCAVLRSKVKLYRGDDFLFAGVCIESGEDDFFGYFTYVTDEANGSVS